MTGRKVRTPFGMWMTAIGVVFSGLFVLVALPVWSLAIEVFGSWPPKFSLYSRPPERAALMWSSWVLGSICFVVAAAAFWAGHKDGWESDSKSTD